MRKLVTLLAIFLTVFTLSANDALIMSHGDIDSVRLFSPSGSAQDPVSEIMTDGYIIISGDSRSSFSSVFGEITLEPDTILAITGYNLVSPSLYLLDGQITINIEDIRNLTVFTSTASYSLSGGGEYSFIYTSEKDLIYNYSDYEMEVYDGIRKQTSVLEGNHYSDLIANELNIPLSLFPADETMAETEEPAEEPVVVSGSYYLRENTVDYAFSTAGYGTIHYSIPELPMFDAASFIMGYAGYTSIPQVMDVVFDASQKGTVNFVYPAGYSEADLKFVIDDFYSYALECIMKINLPAAPDFIRVQTTVDRNAREYAVRTSYDAYGLSLDFAFYTSGRGAITYPAGIVSEKDIGNFMQSYALSTSYDEVREASYDASSKGIVLFSYADGFTEEEIKAVLDEMKAYLDLYITRLASLKAPVFTDVLTISDAVLVRLSRTVSGVPADFAFSTGGNGYITYPSGVISENDIVNFMQSYALSTSYVEVREASYEILADGCVKFSYSDSYSEEELIAVIDDMISYITLYVSRLFSLKAPEIRSVNTFIEILPPAPSDNIVVRTSVERGIPSVPVMNLSDTPEPPSFTSVEIKKN